MRRMLSAFVPAMALAAIAATAGCGRDAAAKYPSAPVEMVTWVAPGSPTDVFARTLSNLAEKKLGKPITVVNKEGGNSAVALTYSLEKPADGYTIVGTTGSMAGFLALGQIPVKMEEFTYIIRNQVDSSLMAVGADSRFKTIQEFIDFARANPGKLKVGGSRVGSVHHLNLFELSQEAKAKIEYVPFEGSNDALVAAMGGHIDAAMGTPGSVSSQVRGGKLRVLAVWKQERVGILKDAATLRESGFNVPDHPQWRGIMARKAVPDQVVAILHDTFKAAMQQAEWRDYMAKSAIDDGYLSTKDFTAAVFEEAKTTAEFLRAVGILKQ